MVADDIVFCFLITYKFVETDNDFKFTINKDFKFISQPPKNTSK